MEKKMIIAIVIVLCLVGGGLFTEYYTEKLLQEFTVKIDTLLETPQAEYELGEITAIHDWWQKKHVILELFLPHNQLTEIELAFGELLGAIKTSDYDSATAMLNRISINIEILEEMYSLRAGNII